MNKRKFIEKKFEEVSGGYYDCGFYYTPNGSFWDDEGYYFNREGFDKHGGYYDDGFNYVPGKDWDQVNECYPSDLEKDEFYEDECDDEGDDFDNHGYDNFMQNYQDDEEDDYGIENETPYLEPKQEQKINVCKQVESIDTKKEVQEISSLIEINTTATLTYQTQPPPKKNKLTDLFGDTKKNENKALNKKK